MVKGKTTKIWQQLAVIVSLVLLVLISLISFRNIQNLLNGSQLARTTQFEIEQMDELISVLRDAETNHRGYIITSDHKFLKPAFQGYQQALKKLKTVGKTSPKHGFTQMRRDSLRKIILFRLSEIRRFETDFISHTRSENKYQIFTLLDTLVDTRKIVREMQLRRYDRLTQNVITLARYSNYASILSVFACLVVISSTIFLYRNVQKTFKARMDLERERNIMEKKDEFLSIASHELKTPLTSMKGYLQIIAGVVKKKGDPGIEPLLLKADKQVNKLTALVRDLLTVSKISADKMEFHVTEFSFNELLEDAIVYANQLSPDHEVIIKGNTDVVITADKNRIEQVLTNLLSNAIKYSHGQKRVIIDVQELPHRLQVSITDFGIGIPEEKLSSIFDRFYRVEVNDYNSSGLGIGLYISSEIMKRHGGSLLVESKPGKGSTFILSLPMESRQKDNLLV